MRIGSDADYNLLSARPPDSVNFSLTEECWYFGKGLVKGVEWDDGSPCLKAS